jgi:sporulation protein YlmC with PRC-barrel domain
MAGKVARALGSWVRGGWLLITLVIGSDALCGDGYRGEVLAVVVDPVARTVTHVVVEPKGRLGLARLVPLGLVDATKDPIRLRCTEAEFKSLDAAEQTLAEFVPGYPVPVQVLSPGWRDAGGPTVEGSTIPRIPEQETIDIIPPGEVEERRGDHVHATDGDIGQVHALRIDPGSHQVTHVLLKEGPLWDRKDVAIPFDKVAGFDDGIRLSITRQQVRDLPSADIDHPAG